MITKKVKFELKFVICKQTKTKITHCLTSAVLFYLSVYFWAL